MNINATQSSLEKFLEIKRAAEQRQKQSDKARTAPVSGSRESFLDIIKSARKKDDNTIIERPAPVERKAPAAALKPSKTAEGLLSVYDMNSVLNRSLSSTPAREALMQTKHLGNLFDAVA